LLGSNLGQTHSNLNLAAASIVEEGIQIVSYSKIYQTAAWGNLNQADFLNAVLKIETRLGSSDLLIKLLEIESKMGRIRGEEQWQPRMIDIDILYYNDEIIESEQLKIPHPYIAQRRFTLVPLNEIAPEFIHPLLNLSNKDLLHRCLDPGQVNLTKFVLTFNNSKMA
jgi:2-amino-4-hydroxy-6-hydroxymethyldihydropteridine diphosphokinase